MAAPISPETLHLSVHELSGKIRKREISPVALAAAYLDGLERVGPSLGAVVTVTRDLAMDEARTAEAEIAAGNWRGPLHGIPYGVKDLLATRGIPTTWGAEPFREQVFDDDATVVRRLREAGAVLIAKLAMVELAGALGYANPDASFTGPGRCPWNVNFWSGGSSAGPGAATAAGLVGFSIGSETSGSIITPAAYSGLSGLRPTYGRVSRHGAMPLCGTLDKLGPMCRTAVDCGLVMAAIAGADPLDPTTVDRRWRPPHFARRFRIGVLRGAAESAQLEVRKNFEEAVSALRSFCDVTDDVPFPDFPYGPAVTTIVEAEAASAFRDLIESGGTRRLRAVNDKRGGFAGSRVLAVDYLQSMRLRAPVQEALDELCSHYDAVVAPSRQTVASPVGVDFDRAYPGIGGGPEVIPAGNLAGQPAISVLSGFGQNGLPTGIQFQGRAFADETLVALAAEYQRRTDWHTRRPPV